MAMTNDVGSSFMLVYIKKCQYLKVEDKSKICHNSCETTEQRALQNHLGLRGVRGEMWGFYPHYIRREHGDTL